MKSSQMAAGNACSVWKQSQTRLFRLWMAKENIFTVFMGILRRFPVTRILKDHTLEHINTIDIGGRNPVDITVDRNNKHVIVATLQGGTIYTIDRKNDGSLGEVIAEFTYEGKEPGKVSTIHQCLWDKKKNFLFACAQSRVNGYGQMRALRYDHETGQFTQTAQFLSRTWDEPRHAAVHPNNRWVYMCEEKGNKVLFFRFDDENGTFEALQELTTVPETVTGYSDASEVMG